MTAHYLRAYFAEMAAISRALPTEQVDAVVQQILAAQARGATVFILGNGGSAGTASHFACDLGKGATSPSGRRVRALSLTDNVPLLTALGNDLGYETIFAEQLAIHGRADDLLIVISGSGNSLNVIRAVEHARVLGIRSVGFLGFEGGRVAPLVDWPVVVPASCIQAVEDAHSILTHSIAVAVREALAEQDAPAATGKRPAIFLDRDGVLNRRRDDHVKRWEEFEFLPGVLEGLAALARVDTRTILLTNQAAIGRGLVPAEVVDDIHARMQARIAAAGGPDLHVYVCPHTPEEGCHCRKPRPGLLEQAMADFDVDLPRSVFVGDSLTDVSAALAAGCRPIFVCDLAPETRDAVPSAVPCVQSFAEAVQLILADPVFGGTGNPPAVPARSPAHAVV